MSVFEQTQDDAYGDGTNTDAEAQYEDADYEVAEDIDEEGDDYFEVTEHVEKSQQEPVTNVEPRVSRGDMLKICGNFNNILKLATEKNVPRAGNAANILLATEIGQKTKESLLQIALKTVEKAVPKAVPTVKQTLEVTKPKTTVVEKEKKTQTKVKVRKVPSFTKLINESMIELGSAPSSPDPPKVLLDPTKEVPKVDPPKKTYTEDEVKALFMSLQPFMKDSEQFTHSTPSKELFTHSTPTKEPSPIPKAKPKHLIKEVPSRVSPRLSQSTYGKKEMNTSVIDEVKNTASKSRKTLFKENVKEDPELVEIDNEDSLETIAPASPNEKQQVSKASMPDAHTQLLEEHRASLEKTHVNIEQTVTKTQENLSACAQKVSGAVILVQARLAASTKKICETVISSQDDLALSTKEAVESITVSMKDHLKEMSGAITSTFENEGQSMSRAMTDILKKSTDEYLESQAKTYERYEDATDAVTTIHEKLIEHMVKREMKLVQGMDKVSQAVNSASDNIEKCTSVMHTGMVSLADGLTKMCNNMSKLLEVNEALRVSQQNSVKTMNDADKALSQIVVNLQQLSSAQETMNKENIARALIQSEFEICNDSYKLYNSRKSYIVINHIFLLP